MKILFSLGPMGLSKERNNYYKLIKKIFWFYYYGYEFLIYNIYCSLKINKFEELRGEEPRIYMRWGIFYLLIFE